MKLNAVTREIGDFGIVSTAKDACFRGIKLSTFAVLRCMALNRVNPDFLQIAEGFSGRLMKRDKLLAFSQNAAYGLTEAFINRAMAKGDECYGILDGDCLTSYGWYSNLPTVLTDHLFLRFDRSYMYMYSGFTHRNYRGMRLHACGMMRSLGRYLALGFKGLVAYVEENNTRSLRSTYRMGYRDFGKIYILKVLNKTFFHLSKGCERYGMDIFPDRAGDSRS